jgi:hypothetical protein
MQPHKETHKTIKKIKKGFATTTKSKGLCSLFFIYAYLSIHCFAQRTETLIGHRHLSTIGILTARQAEEFSQVTRLSPRLLVLEFQQYCDTVRLKYLAFRPARRLGTVPQSLQLWSTLHAREHVLWSDCAGGGSPSALHDLGCAVCHLDACEQRLGPCWMLLN